MSAETGGDGGGTPTVDDRDVRALTSTMSVLPNLDPSRDDLPPVAGVPGVFLVVTTSENVVFADPVERCTCDDHYYRGVRCKHIRRVAFETGAETVPDWADPSAIDDQFRDYIDR